MIRKVLMCGGLLLICVLIGQLVLNAAGVGAMALAKDFTGKALSLQTGKVPTITKAAPKSDVKSKTGDLRENSAQRKALEAAARAAGYNPGRLSELTESQVQALLREAKSGEQKAPVLNAPRKSAPTPDSGDHAQKSRALKARLKTTQTSAADARPEATVPAKAKATQDARERALIHERETQRLRATTTPTRTQTLDQAMSAEEIVAQAATAYEQRQLRLVRQMSTGPSLNESEKQAVKEYLAAHPSARPNADGSLDNNGGSVAAGYLFRDNVSPDTATFDWIELQGATDVHWIFNWYWNTDDAVSDQFPLGFNFRFYNTLQDSFLVSTNGTIQFSSASPSFENSTLPASEEWSGVPGPAIFPFWDDLHLEYGRINPGLDVVGWKNFGSYVVIEWDSAGHCCEDGSSYKFEAILFDDGRIKLQYQTLNFGSNANSQTIGIQADGAAGSAAVQYVANSSGIQPASGRAIWFIPVILAHDCATGGITVPTPGNYAPNEVLNVTARFYNLGTTTVSAPVKYTFNGGATVTEATAELARFTEELHAFSVPITLPGVTGSYPLTVWTDLTGDENRANDSVHTHVIVFSGGSCNGVLALPAGSDSALYNNCDAGDDNPGQPCGPSYQDMVFSKDVDPGHTVSLWVSTVFNNPRLSLRWGGLCPGTNVVDCFDTAPFAKRLVWNNSIGSTQSVFLTIGSEWGGSAYCGNFMLNWMDEVGATVEPPYVQNFESVLYVPLLPPGMTMANNDGLSPVWESLSAGAMQGTKCGSIPGSDGGNNDWLFTPGIALEEGRDYVVEYWRRVGSPVYPDSMAVWAGLAPTAEAMLIPVAVADTCQRTVYVNKLGGFTASTSEPYYIGWHNLTRNSSARTYIDSIQIAAAEACVAPVVTAISAEGADSVALGISLEGGYGGAPRFQWFTGVGCEEANRIAGATGATRIVHESGTYSVRAWIIDSVACASCDSAYAAVLDCSNPMIPPLIDGFEVLAPDYLPWCWTEENGGEIEPAWTTNPWDAHSGTNAAFISYNGAAPLNDWLFTRPLLLNGNETYFLDYWYRVADSWFTERMEIMLGLAPTSTAMTSLVRENWMFSNDTYIEQTDAVNVPVTGIYYIGFHAISNANQLGIYLDDISLANTCTAPELSVPAVSGADSAVLTANALGGMGGPIQYQWYTGTECLVINAIPGATSSTYTTTTSGIFSCRAWRSDLESCAACDSASADVVNCAIPLDLPVTQTFDNATVPELPACWTQQNDNSDESIWVSAAEWAQSGNGAYIRFSNWETGPENDWLFSCPVTLTAGGIFLVDYWYRMAWDWPDYTEQMAVWVGTAPNAAAMTIELEPQFSFDNISYAQGSNAFTVPATGVYYIGWHALSDADQGGIALDDIAIYGQGDCSAPTALEIPSLSGVAAVTLTATAGGGYGGILQYQWYSGSGCVAANEIVGATDRTYVTVASGVYSCKAYYNDPNTCGICASGEATVLPDPCLPGIVPPLYQGFDVVATPDLPDCWSAEDRNGMETWQTVSWNWLSPPNDVRISGSNEGNDDWLFAQPVQLTAGTTYHVEYRRVASWAEDPQALMVAIATGRNHVFVTDTLIAPFMFNNTAWERDLTTFTPETTGSYYLAFQSLTAGATWAETHLDDIYLYADGDCGAPSAVTVNSTVGPDSASLSCAVSGGFGGTLQYQWYSGATCDEAHAIAGATEAGYTTTTSGVYACKAYMVDADNCAGCDSAIATVLPCATNPVTLPLYEDFETLVTPDLPGCWRQQDVNEDGLSWIGAFNRPHSGVQSAFLTGTASPVPVDDWLFTKPISLTANDTVLVSYWCRMYLWGFTESMEVYAGLAARADAMTLEIEPNFTFSNTEHEQHEQMFIAPTTGDYYFGWHGTSGIDQGGIIVDDIFLYHYGDCDPPTAMDVPAAAFPGSVTLTASASGGFGGPIQYQWYSGIDCNPANVIAGATTAQYITTTSGVYSCRAYRVTPDSCWVCDSGYADVLVPQPGELCDNALSITPPTEGVPTGVPGSTEGFFANCSNSCISNTSSDADVFYTLTLTGLPQQNCRRIAVALAGGDMHLAVYNDPTNCCGTSLLCNDNDAEFTELPGWDVAAQHPGGMASYVAAELEPGTYYIRVAAYDGPSAYTLTVYDNGLCNEPCDSATALSVYLDLANPSRVWWHFNAPAAGTYKVFSTTVNNNDGNPDNGADPQWSLDTTLEVEASGPVECVDLDGLAVGGYENFVIVHDCPILGRCCYGDPLSPSCEDLTQAPCLALNGGWDRYRRCGVDPCPIVQPAPGENCADVSALVGPLPIVVTGNTTGHVNDFPVGRLMENPACWGEGFARNAFHGPDVCWSWIVLATATYTFSLCNGPDAWDTCLLLYSNTCPILPANSQILCGDDDACPADVNGQSVMSEVSLTEGQNVLIVIDGFSSESMGVFRLDITTP